MLHLDCRAKAKRCSHTFPRGICTDGVFWPAAVARAASRATRAAHAVSMSSSRVGQQRDHLVATSNPFSVVGPGLVIAASNCAADSRTRRAFAIVGPGASGTSGTSSSPLPRTALEPATPHGPNTAATARASGRSTVIAKAASVAPAESPAAARPYTLPARGPDNGGSRRGSVARAAAGSGRGGDPDGSSSGRRGAAKGAGSGATTAAGRRGGGGRSSSSGGGEGEGGAWVASGEAGGGAAGGSREGASVRLEPLATRVRDCRSLRQLVRLYDTSQRSAEQQARVQALGAGAAAAAAGLARSPPLPASVVWMFLAAAAELVADWRRQWQAGQRAERGRDAAQMREQLAYLLREASAVVLWAERLAPAKVCLMLSLLVAAGRYQGSEQHLGLLVEDSLNSLEDYSSGQVALAASSFARLRYHPGNGWLETLLEATSGRLSSWRPVDLGFTLWSLAKWKATPPAAWLQEFYEAYEGCGERVCESDLSMVCWAVGIQAVVGGRRPPARFVNHLMLEVQVRLPTMSNQGLAHVAWGLRCCDVTPPRFWLREFYEAARAALPFARCGLTFSNLLWAQASWQRELHPGAGWLEEACKQSARCLASLDSRSMAVLLLALADLEHTPPAEWVGLALETAHRKLSTTDPPSAVAVLWAVSRFERQRAAAAAAAAAEDEAAPLPPRRRRLSSLAPEELMLIADDIGFGFGAGASSTGTPPHLRPPRKWLVRYTPLLQGFAMAAAGIAPPASAAGTTAAGAGITALPEGRSSAAAAAGSSASAAPTIAAAAPAAVPRYAFQSLDANQMLDVAVALADLYVYPGDAWMAAHEARMTTLGGGTRGQGGRGAGLTPYQWQMLLAAYAALDDTWEEYAAPRAGERY